MSQKTAKYKLSIRYCGIIVDSREVPRIIPDIGYTAIFQFDIKGETLELFVERIERKNGEKKDQEKKAGQKRKAARAA